MLPEGRIQDQQYYNKVDVGDLEGGEQPVCENMGQKQ